MKLRRWLDPIGVILAGALLVGLTALGIWTVEARDAKAAVGTSAFGLAKQINVLGTTATDCPAIVSGAGSAAAAVYDAGGWSTNGSLGFTVQGTFVGTISTSASVDGVNFQLISAFNGFTFVPFSTLTATSNANVVPRSGWRYVCLVFTAYTSGAALVTFEPQSNTMVVMPTMTTASSPQTLRAGSASMVSSVNASSAALMVTPAGEIMVNSTPAVNTQASASVTAGAATVRHVATSCSGSIAAVAAQTQATLNLRDGATGAGTVLWSGTIMCAIGTPCVLTSPPLNAFGTAATAMTCEWGAIPSAGNFEVANLAYKDAS